MSESKSSHSKRLASQLDRESGRGRPLCKYGESCYRKNPQHFEDFCHPHLDSVEDPTTKRQKLDDTDEDVNSGKSAYFLLTKVTGIPTQFNKRTQSISIKEILSTSYGELKASAQFNYMFEIPWLMEQYPVESRSKPLLIVHGDSGTRKATLEAEASSFKNIRFFQCMELSGIVGNIVPSFQNRILEAHLDIFKANLSIPYGTHHSKMMLLLYKDGMRVVIHTANLIEMDWRQKTQGVWVSPFFPRLGDSAAIEVLMEDNFKKDLLDYLDAYGSSEELEIWKKEIKNHNMISAKARIIASTPGRHTGLAKSKWGHLRLRHVLQQIGPELSAVDEHWPVIGQFSSIGSLGTSERTWLCSEWLQSLASGRRKLTGSESKLPSLKLIFPTIENVRTSFEGYKAGGSLPYSDQNAMKQMYLLGLFHQWKSDNLGRSRASPHIKSYTRVSPENSHAAWFLLTSANLSKAAWGVCEKSGSQLMIRSYEIGVLLLPQSYDKEANFFRIASECSYVKDKPIPSTPMLRLPYDVPLKPYDVTDSPWVWDRNYTKEDSLSGIWRPRQ